MSAQLVSLEAKATELEVMISYVHAKIDYLKGGQRGPRTEWPSPNFRSILKPVLD